MNCFTLLIWLAVAQMPPVHVVTLAGDQTSGSIESFSANSIVLKTDAKMVTIPIAEVLLIRSNPLPAPAAAETPIEVRLIDQTKLIVKSLMTFEVKSANPAGKSLIALHPSLGELRIPVSSVASIRLTPPDAKVDADWNQLLDRTIKKDVVAVRKGDVLDHLDGIIGSLSDSTMQFQMDGEDITVKREKVFGLIYSKRESIFKKSIAQLELATGDKLSLKQIDWDGTKWKAKLVTGIDVVIDPEQFLSLDYSLGKVMYLSDMEPRLSKHTPLINFPSTFLVNEYRRDKNFDGTPIGLGGKAYAKGLAIHSQSVLKYRFGGDYRRFQAVMGIGDEVPLGDVDVVLKGDNKTLFKGAVKANEMDEKGNLRRAAPQSLDIDVTGVVEFEIFVDYGSDKRDIGDRLYLASARAVK